MRNPNWSQSTDTIHKPLVDKVVLTIDTNPTDADDKLKAGTFDANAADPGVYAGFQTQILTNPTLKKNADDPVTASTRYLAVMPSVIPNVNCRQAIFYATNKASAAASVRRRRGRRRGRLDDASGHPGLRRAARTRTLSAPTTPVT